MINLFQPSVGEEELAELHEVFSSHWLGQGEQTAKFEAGFAEWIGVPADRMVSVNSGTEALFLAVAMAGIGPGDEVVMPSISYVGAANAVHAAGGRAVFCDVDRHTLNPTCVDIEAVLTPRTKAVVVLHYGGYPGDVVQISELCRDRGILLIEDAACAIASSVDGQKVGTFGDIATWSFGAGKILVAGDGGMVHAASPDLASDARVRRFMGLDKWSGYSQSTGQTQRWWDFDVRYCSNRSNTNDIASAIANVQLRRLPGFLSRRAEVVAQYDAELAGLVEEGVLQLPPTLPALHETSYYFYWVQMDPRRRDQTARDLLDAGIYTSFRYAPLHRVPVYRESASLPETDHAAARTLCLPLHQALSTDDVRQVVDQLARSLRTSQRWAS